MLRFHPQEKTSLHVFLNGEEFLNAANNNSCEISLGDLDQDLLDDLLDNWNWDGNLNGNLDDFLGNWNYNENEF